VNVKILTVVLISCLFVAATAHAQGLTRQWDEMTPLTEQDRGIIRNTVQRDIHGKPSGTVVNWANPTSGHSGKITLLSSSVYQGMPCEQIEYLTMEPGGTALHGRYVFKSCRLPDGTWKLAD
jgi:surface antigen